MNRDENLIYDVGMHKCEDTSYYLSKGYKVISIDADLGLIEAARNRFAEDVLKGKLVLLNYAISDNDNDDISFNISESTVWSSLKKDISGRDKLKSKTVSVKTRKLSSLIKENGLPFYCKIDIEGYDAICLQTISDLEYLPMYISVETECLGEHETISEEEALLTLNNLYDLGYRKFKLVDQYSLNVLRPNVEYYASGYSFFKKHKYLEKVLYFMSCRYKLSKKYQYKFPLGSTGPFGDDLDYRWLDYEEAKKTLLFHRKSYFNLPASVNYGFWCDWHATI